MAANKTTTTIIDPADDVLLLGMDELSLYDGDLRQALARRPEIRAEILVAWLASQLGGEGYARDCVLMAAGVVGEVDSGFRRHAGHQLRQ